MTDMCELLGVKKLNTTSYHPQCDGMVERLNRTLKAMLRKHVAKFHSQWDRFLPGVLWAYRNTPHESTKEKPSFLLFGIDLRSPTEASFLPPESLDPTDLGSYREELIVSLSSARELAASSIQEAQKSYKTQYDKKVRVVNFRVGDWVFVRFPEEETGRNRKLSRPWYGPFRIICKQDPNLTVRKVYFPEDPELTIHQLRVCPSPSMLPAGFYWYGAKRRSRGRTPTWLQRMLNATAAADQHSNAVSENFVAPAEDTEMEKNSQTNSTPVSDEDIQPPTPAASDTDQASSISGPDQERQNVEDVLPFAGEDDPTEPDCADLPAVQPSESAPPATTNPATPRYPLREQSSRRQPQRLMQVGIDTGQFGTN